MGFAKPKLYRITKFDLISVRKQGWFPDRLSVDPYRLYRLDEIPFTLASNHRMAARNIAQNRHIDRIPRGRLPQHDLIRQADEITADGVDPQQES